jgi:phosphoribosyl 1,2-cyclic phosphodiesterase
MNIIVLNSGSNGNAVYVESPASGAGVLLDCGISCRQIELRLGRHDRTPAGICGIFITHEHADHVRGLPVMTKRNPIPTFLTEATWRRMHRNRPRFRHEFMANTGTVRVSDIEIQAIPKSHDAADPVSFLVTIQDTRFLYATDLGAYGGELTTVLAGVDVAMIESNYDEDMLLAGPYPPHLKHRIRSAHGHLSNRKTMELIGMHCNGRLQMLILGHLSANNNTPELVLREFETAFAGRSDTPPHVVVASRYDVGELISIQSSLS